MFERDICAGKHGGNAQSVAANLRAAKTKEAVRERILAYLGFVGEATVKETAKAFGKLPHEISGRFTALKGAGVIVPTGNVRDNSMAYRVASERERVQPALF